MSREQKDSDYKPKLRVLQRRRTPRKLRQTEAVDYSECEMESDIESESRFSEGNTTIEGEQLEIKGETLETLWAPSTFSRKAEEVQKQCSELTQQETMAKKIEQSGMDRILVLFMQMRKDDRERDERREMDDRKREVERLKREEKRED